MRQLREQKYSNLNRKYYHGSDHNKRIYDRFIKPTSLYGMSDEYPCTWLTTNVLYAMDYSGYDWETNTGPESARVYICKLIDETNIFNVQSKSNRIRFIRKSHAEGLKIADEDIYDLFSNDWTMLKNIQRKEIINVVRGLGFEGLFNYEHGQVYAPSVGLFNSELAEIIEEVPIKDFETKFQKQISNGYKRADVILSEKLILSNSTARTSKVPFQLLRESYKKLIDDDFDDFWEFEF